MIDGENHIFVSKAIFDKINTLLGKNGNEFKKQKSDCDLIVIGNYVIQEDFTFTINDLIKITEESENNTIAS